MEAELRAGNRILRSGGGHPAPPAGDLVLLAEDLHTRLKDLPSGLRYYARNSSAHHEEITDDAGFCWVLTAPLPPPPEPDMDAIREAANRPSAPPPPAPAHYPPGSVEMDPRGELLILHEADRRADIVWTWNRGDQLYRSSLSPWWYPAERRAQPMTDAEREAVIARFLDFARQHINPRIELKD